MSDYVSREDHEDRVAQINAHRMDLQDRIETLNAEIAELQQALVDAEPIPYCEVCGSCGEIGCGCTHKCKFPFDHPDVNDRIEAQAAEIERLREAGAKLNNHACHDDDCQIVTHGVWSDPIPCTCGYEDAWKLWSAALGGNDE